MQLVNFHFMINIYSCLYSCSVWSPRNPRVSERNSVIRQLLSDIRRRRLLRTRGLDLYFGNFSHQIPQGTTPIPIFIDVPQLDAGLGSNLDLQLAYPLRHPQTITLYQTGDLYYTNGLLQQFGGGFNTFLDAIDGVGGVNRLIWKPAD